MILGIVDNKPDPAIQKADLFFQLQPSLNRRSYTKISCGFAEFGYADTEETPFLNYSGTNLFVSEGRIDNRSELCQLLNLPMSCSDAVLIHEAYKKWSKACVNKLIGDWAFVNYDTETREIFLARDQHGFTSLFVYQDDSTFAFSSSIKHLIPLAASAPNPKFIIGRLCQVNHADIHDTIFRKIYKISAGHTFTVKNRQLAFEKYWFPENIRLRNYTNPDDYAEEFLEIIKEAVRSRLRGNKPFASMLSGGFDSGTVSNIAAELLGNEKLTSFSHVPQFINKLPPATKNKFFDETPYIDANAGVKPNIVSIKFDAAEISPLQGIEKYVEVFDNIIHGAGNAYWMTSLYEKVADGNFGVLFGGDNGNGALSYTGINYLLPYTHPYFLARPKEFFKQKLIRPLVSRFVAERRIRQRLDFQFEEGLVNPEASTESGIYDEVSSISEMYSSIFTNHQHNILLLIDVASRYRVKSDISSYYSFNYRDPTADIRLFEFCLSVPNEIFFNAKGQNKALIRKAMQGRLPDKVLNATGTGQQSADLYFRIQQDFLKIDEWIHVLAQNQTFTWFINIEKLKSHFELLKSGKQINKLFIGRILKTLMLGIFLEKKGFR